MTNNYTREKKSLRIPKRLQIETIYNCNARCVMCATSFPAAREKGLMTMELFKSIVDRMAPYSQQIEKVDLFGLGEPLLDPHIFERLAYTRLKGFRNLAISTNADLLDRRKSEDLLKSGVETVIFSIDGVKKETHENIRKGVNFERVVENCERTIKLRDGTGVGARFVLRFIRQESNRDQWEAFKQFWLSRLSPDKGDILIAYDMNSMGGEVCAKEDLVGSVLDEEIERMPCNQVFDRLIVLRDGTVPFCCEDTPRAANAMGSALETEPIDIFNSEPFSKAREIHSRGEKNSIPLCRECTVLYSEKTAEVIEGQQEGRLRQ